MPTEFDLIFDDFSTELDALAEMAGAPTTPAAGISPRVRIAAGNGATLLLAAIFEEYVRQQVRAAFRVKVGRAKSMNDFPERIVSAVWRRSFETLARTSFREIESDVRRTDERITSILSFCLKKDINADIGETLSHNENNMRLSQLNTLFNLIGVTSISAGAATDQELIDHLGCEGPGKAIVELESRIDDFFRRRNAIAHAIKLASSSGPSELYQDIELFRIFGRALSRKLNQNT
jgi:hypothetical protein